MGRHWSQQLDSCGGAEAAQVDRVHDAEMREHSVAEDASPHERGREQLPQERPPQPRFQRIAVAEQTATQRGRGPHQRRVLHQSRLCEIARHQSSVWVQRQT